MNARDVKALIENSGNRTTTHLGTRESRLGVEEKIGLRDTHRLIHVLTVGPTGYGKSTVMQHAALQDAVKGYGLCIINVKGRTLSDDLLAKLPENRHSDVIYLNPDDEQVTPINVLEPHVTPDMSPAQIENQKEIIVSDLIDLFKRYSENWGDRFGRVLETLFRAHLDRNIRREENTTLIDVFQCVVNTDKLTDLIDETEDPVVREQLVRVKEDLGSYEMEPLQRRLNDFVMNTTVRRVIAQEESGFDFRDALLTGKIIVVDVQKGEVGDMVAKLIGSIVITKVWAAAQSRITLPEAEREPFYLFVDELQNFAGEGSNFTKVLSEAREYGLGCWLATQYLHQLAPAMRRAVTNNARTKIVFNPSGSDDENRIAGMLTGVDKQQLKRLGKYRAVMQRPGEQAHQEAVVFDTFPPWDADWSPVDTITQKAAHPGSSPPSERRLQQSLGQGQNAGSDQHTELLQRAKRWFEQTEGVQVQLLYQDTGAEKPDGYIRFQNGDIAHLEAELSTLSKPDNVLRNYQRAVEHDKTCIFVVEAGNATKLEEILADADEPHTDYRIFEAADSGFGEYTSDTECPELEHDTRASLENFCMHREPDGFCTVLNQSCVLNHE